VVEGFEPGFQLGSQVWMGLHHVVRIEGPACPMMPKEFFEDGPDQLFSGIIRAMYTQGPIGT
jgi:hypothetical protein